MQMKSNNTKPINVWDPAGGILDKEKFSVMWSEVQAQHDDFKNPQSAFWKLHRFYQLLAMGVAGFIFLVAFEFKEIKALGLLFFPAIILMFSRRNILRLQKDLVKGQLASNNGWVYNPVEDPVHWQKMADKYPVLFDKGNRGRNFSDEFWGKLKTSVSEHDFYFGIFHYAKQPKSSDRDTRHFYKSVFALRLEKKIKQPLLLLPETNRRYFAKKLNDIDLESEVFNNLFRVEVGKDNPNFDMIRVFKKLSPVVQEKLITLADEYTNPTIYFVDDVFFFVRDGFLFPSRDALARMAFGDTRREKVGMYTDLLKNPEIDQRDEVFLQEQFKDLIDISSNVAKYLD
jgi:hypothetical protein